MWGGKRDPKETQYATVIRNGNVQEIDKNQMVPGDIVQIKVGDTAHADLVIFKSNGLKTENKSLVGEPVIFTINVDGEQH